MWLINTRNFTLREVLDPGEDHPYAILSHTWDEVEDDCLHHEVTFQDMRDLDMARRKTGWSKIAKTCELAQNINPSLEWAWIDTCCIDKSSSAGLTEAINSMFQWYREANVCFVYLSDLPRSPTGKPESRAAKVQLRDFFPRCRWLTRGWTLQELIAPTKVHFYDMSWTMRGTKETLKDVISSATGIELAVLNDNEELSDIPVARRMYWASHRTTKRVEDAAYSLFGIFDVNMPLIYGEGHKAFLRLQDAIAQQVNDLTLFAWTTSSDDSAVQRYHGMFAQSPRNFKSCKDIVPILDPQINEHHSFKSKNRGLKFRAVCKEDSDGGGYLMNLYCYNEGIVLAEGRPGILAIRLVRTLNGFIRQRPESLVVVSESLRNSVLSGKLVSLSVPKHINTSESRQLEARLQNAFRFRIQCPSDISVKLFRGAAQGTLSWDPVTSTFLTGGYPKFVGSIKLSISSHDTVVFGDKIIAFGLRPVSLEKSTAQQQTRERLEPRVTWLGSGEKYTELLGEKSIDWLPGIRALLKLHGSPWELSYVDEYMQRVIMDNSVLLEERILTPHTYKLDSAFKRVTIPHEDKAMKLSLRLQDIEEDGVTLHEVIVRFEPSAPRKSNSTSWENIAKSAQRTADIQHEQRGSGREDWVPLALPNYSANV